MILKMTDENIIKEILSTIESNTKKPEKFLSAQPGVASKFRKELKTIYDFTHNEVQRKSNALPELVIDGFDEEQIWQQLEILNDSEITHLLGAVSRVLAGNKSLELPVSPTKPSQENSQSDEDDDDEEGKNIASDDTNDDDDDDDDEEDNDDDKDIEDEDENSEMNFSGSDDELNLDGSKRKKEKESSKKQCKTSIVDDEFFKLDELDEYLNKEDKKEMNEEDDKSDSESVDMFEDEEEPGEEDEARMMKFSDFFDRPRNSNNDKPPRNQEESFQEKMDDEEEEINSKKRKFDEPEASKKRVKFNLLEDNEDEKEAKDDDDGDNIKSTLEARQERLKKKIECLEKEAISEKPWQLKGEVTANNRPENSLLEEFVEVDIATRPAPVYTEEVSAKLEDIIIQRIKDKAWDSVERKYKPVEEEPEYRKKLVMDQEKSTKSLAQVYEDDYVKQKEAQLNPDGPEREEEEPKAHQEIRQLMHSLFAKLDALSNFHFTPKLAKPEIKIVSNIPAITMEEVAPLATTDATLLAPEEITKKPRGDVIGKSERTKTDVKRDRRKKKIHQKEKAKIAEKKEQAMKDKPIKNKKQAKILEDSMVKKLTKDKRITKIDESNQKLPKSSTAFFTRLQDQKVSKK